MNRTDHMLKPIVLRGEYLHSLHSQVFCHLLKNYNLLFWTHKDISILTLRMHRQNEKWQYDPSRMFKYTVISSPKISHNFCEYKNKNISIRLYNHSFHSSVILKKLFFLMSKIHKCDRDLGQSTRIIHNLQTPFIILWF